MLVELNRSQIITLLTCINPSWGGGIDELTRRGVNYTHLKEGAS